MADRRLQVFHAVAKHLSFTRAADDLFMTQPAVTFQIRQLEEQFGTRLFERGHARIALTPAGELVRDYAARILALTDEMETRLAEMTGEMRGLLPVGASTTLGEFLLPRILGEFNALYPQVRARLVVGNSEAIEQGVVERSVEVGLIERPPRHSDLGARACGGDELVAMCAPDHPLAGVAVATPRLLQEYEFVAREPGSAAREAAEAWFRAAGIEPDRLKTLMELGSPEALKGAVATGLGCALVSRLSVEGDIRAGTLAAVPLKPEVRREYFLVYPQDRFQSRLAATFIDFAQQKLRETAS